VEPLPLSLVILTRITKSQEIFQLNSLIHIILKVELCRAQTGLGQWCNLQNFGHVWANCEQPLDVCGHPHRECLEKTNAESTLSCCNCTLVEGKKSHPVSYQFLGMRKGNCKGEEHELPWDHLGGHSSPSSPHQISPMQLYCSYTCNTSNRRHCRHMGEVCGSPCIAFVTPGNSENQVCQYKLPIRLRMTC
jgi:hypothetical protein